MLLVRFAAPTNAATTDSQPYVSSECPRDLGLANLQLLSREDAVPNWSSEVTGRRGRSARTRWGDRTLWLGGGGVAWLTGVADVRVRLAGANCADGPGLVRINLTVDGTPTRVQLSGRSMELAISTAVQRLEWKIRRFKPSTMPYRLLTATAPTSRGDALEVVRRQSGGSTPAGHTRSGSRPEGTAKDRCDR